ncbi:MAG: glycosyltransferase family 4 protein [Candidatus Methylomirabilis oxyfera]|nr:glycosyltransferase family 4 protein [Candidatus Methylomirabilis oxyfera]
MGLQVPASLISVVLLRVWPARQRLLQNVGRFIAPSLAVAQSLRESGYPTERIVIVPHGLPPCDDLVRPRTPKLRLRGAHLLYVGRLVSHKGVQYLLEALHQVRQVYPELILTLAGDGPFRPQLERLAASMGLSEAARFIGLQPRSRLFELYAEADLMVVPSLSESFCYVALEGAMAGIPIVATNVGGIPDVLGDAAILVPPMDPAALARGILTLLSDSTTATANATQARERAVARFGFETMVDRVESLYAELFDA